jgi:branched-chain amino acid transport system substrate-binding protein
MIRSSLATIAAALLLTAPGMAVAAPLSGDAVRLGVMNDMSGLYADISGKGGVEAARMAVEDFGGKVLGKPIEVVSADHQNKPDVGAAIARRWYDSEGVDAIFDVPTSSVALAVQQITRERPSRVAVFSGPASSDITGKACAPNTIHWTYDTYALANGTGGAIVANGGTTWFFLTADYAFGHALERDTANVVKAKGGKVLGVVRHPLNTLDFASYLLQAQASGAEIVGLANAGGDTINAIKQAANFGIVQQGQKLAGLLIFVSDIHSLGLKTAQGLQLTSPFYWDMNDAARAWSKRFKERTGRMPTMVQAGIYTGVLHYLKAVKAAETDDGKAVAAQMKRTPINDFMSKDVKIRADGRPLRDFYLFEVKAPAESKGEWDYYKQLRRIPAEDAARPLAESECPLVKQSAERS